MFIKNLLYAPLTRLSNFTKASFNCCRWTKQKKRLRAALNNMHYIVISALKFLLGMGSLFSNPT